MYKGRKGPLKAVENRLSSSIVKRDVNLLVKMINFFLDKAYDGHS